MSGTGRLAPFLQVRPLDPANSKKLDNIRTLFLRVDQKTGCVCVCVCVRACDLISLSVCSEVNGQLDVEMEKRRVDSLQAGRSAASWSRERCYWLCVCVCCTGLL